MTVFLTVRRYLNVRKPNTKRSYFRAYRQWSDSLKAQHRGTLTEMWQNASEKDALKFVSELQRGRGSKPRNSGNSRNYSGATIRLRLVALKEIYKLLFIVGEAKRNPFVGSSIRIPNARWNMKRDTEIVEFDRVPELIERPSAYTNDGVRDRAMLALLFGCGLRRSEVINLQVGDIIHLKGDRLGVRLGRTKTGQDFELPIPEWAAIHIAKYVARRNQEHKVDESQPLFVRYRGPKRTPIPGKIPDKTFYRIFKRACFQAGLPPTITPHSARATAITRLLDQGLSHREVQWFSRHSHVQAVETYDKKKVTLENNPGKILSYVDSPLKKTNQGDRHKKALRE
jgi:integrase